MMPDLDNLKQEKIKEKADKTELRLIFRFYIYVVPWLIPGWVLQ